MHCTHRNVGTVKKMLVLAYHISLYATVKNHRILVASNSEHLLLQCLHAGMLHAKLLQSCLTLCNPMNCSPPGSSVHGISMARILDWVAISDSRGSSQPTYQTHISCIGRIGFFFHCITWERR